IPCSDAGQHLFWDDFHPTTQADLLLAAAFATAVPEPEIFAMLVAGLFILGLASARRRQVGKVRLRAGGLPLSNPVRA
ncbi:MAG: PEP-CTERM sorting domain-containing protein, partial [Nitrosospira sp.]|nr:PEP-CTERM sorting domain-containing protein [Nitrosospira sp.]